MWVVLLGDDGCGVWGGPTRRVRAPGRKRGCTPPAMRREKAPRGAGIFNDKAPFSAFSV